jgi:hypothetical protein
LPLILSYTTELISLITLHFRSRLKAALDGAGAAGDNYARALALALVAAHYLHTAGDTAEQMLRTCRQLAGGLGGPVSGAPSAAANKEGISAGRSLGNAVLGLWIGEKFLGEWVLLRGEGDSLIGLAIRVA